MENLLALARDVVGVTLGMSCMAAIVLHVPGEDGGGHATSFSGVAAIGISSWVSGFSTMFVLCQTALLAEHE